MMANQFRAGFSSKRAQPHAITPDKSWRPWGIRTHGPGFGSSLQEHRLRNFGLDLLEFPLNLNSDILRQFNTPTTGAWNS
jgi:hypothetical protein